AQLKTLMDTEKEDFTVSRMANLSAGLKRPLFDLLSSSTYQHIPDTPQARQAVVGELGLAGRIDPARTRLEDIVSLMIQYHGNGGVVPQRVLERSPAYIPPAQPAVQQA
ncbi:MAG: hypothetical protein AABX60_00140, partial [Nanoarchaeota archaeon]